MSLLANMWWRLVRGGFYLLYNQMAFTYDWVSKIVSLGQWRCWQQSTLAYMPDPQQGFILELAHGTGDLQLDLQDAGYRTIGYDLSPSMGRIATHKLRTNGKSVDLVRGVAQQLPYPDDTFAGIVCTFPTDFITAPDTLREIYRVLQPHASAAIVLGGDLTSGGIIRAFIAWLYRITGQRDTPERDTRKLFTGYGFTSVESLRYPCKNSEAHLIVLQK